MKHGERPHTFIPVAEAVTPRDGEVLCNRWWVVTPNAEIILWRGHSPQCNSDVRAAETILKKVWPDYEIVHLPAVYLGVIKERWDLA